jgi:hypothetical protein
LVPAGKVQTAFFVVTGTASGSRNDLAVTNKFAVVLRQVTGEMDPHRKVTAEWHEPPDTIPTAQSGWHEPSLPGANDGPAPTPPSEVTKKSSGRSRGHRKKAAINASKEATAQPSTTSKVAKQ